MIGSTPSSILLAAAPLLAMAAGALLARGQGVAAASALAGAAVVIWGLHRFVIVPHHRVGAVLADPSLGLMGRRPAEAIASLVDDLRASRRAERHLDEVIETMAGALILADSERRILRVNPAARELTGFEESELVGADLDKVFPERQPINTGSLIQLSTSGRVRNVERAFRHRDGSEIPVLFSGTALRDGDGEPKQYVCVAYDIRRNKEYEARLRSSVEEKELLLREVHHRVKNNLQVISSLLDLQSEHLEDPFHAELIRDSRHRIRSMALIHEQLYRHDDLSDVKLGPYLENIAAHLFRSFGVEPGRIVLRCRLEDIAIDLDRAVSCGLIANELISNSLEHAFTGGRRGEIRIALRRHGESGLELEVVDDGRGFDNAPGADGKRGPSSMGLGLVAMMAQQLRGSLAVDSRTGEPGSGSTFVVRFPADPVSEAGPELGAGPSSGERGGTPT